MLRDSGRPGMRDRLTEFIPLLLVGVVLLAFQFTRGNSALFQFQALPEVTPTPVVAVAVGGHRAVAARGSCRASWGSPTRST